jgi:hypothetical protein
VDDLVKELLAANLELTRLNMELARELGVVKRTVPQLPEPAYERLYMTEDEEDEAFLREHDPTHGVDMNEVAEVLAISGLAPTIEVQ